MERAEEIARLKAEPGGEIIAYARGPAVLRPVAPGGLCRV